MNWITKGVNRSGEWCALQASTERLSHAIDELTFDQTRFSLSSMTIKARKDSKKTCGDRCRCRVSFLAQNSLALEQYDKSFHSPRDLHEKSAANNFLITLFHPLSMLHHRRMNPRRYKDKANHKRSWYQLERKATRVMVASPCHRK